MQRSDSNRGGGEITEHKIDQAIASIGPACRAAEAEGSASCQRFNEDVISAHDGDTTLERVTATVNGKFVGKLQDLAAVGVPWSAGAQTGETQRGRALRDAEIRRTPLER